MKIITKISIAIFISSILSCDKENDHNNLNVNAVLIQNEWETISQRIVMRNGETHLILCDKESFKKDGKFILSYTNMSGNTVKDSSIYQLQPDNITLNFYSYNNGILNTTKPEISKIKTLNQHLLVYHCLREDGSVSIIDSLRR